MRQWSVCLTFDVDLVDHIQGTPLDEFADVLPAVEAVFDRHPHWVATWFIRLDDQIAAVMGRPTALFDTHHAVLNRLRGRNHELAWHPHAYVRAGGAWRQNTEPRSVAGELARLAPAALARGLSAVRTGWGFHTNETMRAIADAGFTIDSSAIPRPRYAWDPSVKDWTVTPLHPYRPSERDYRVPGDPHLPLLEIPISVTRIGAAYDTEPVLRYLNPAFHPHALLQPLSGWFDRFAHLVTVTHPYELMPRARHELIAHDVTAFEQNVAAIDRLARDRQATADFLTVSQFAARVSRTETAAS